MASGRRHFLRSAALALGAVAAGGPAALAARRRRCDDVPGSEVRHVLPTASHDGLLLKVSFREPQRRRPLLRVGRRAVPGLRTDTAGEFWAFDVRHLEPGRRYDLELRRGGCRVGEPWELSTLPAPNARPDHFRLLIYTCAGGHDLFPLYVPAPLRRRLLRRALSFAPDAAVAVGDHVYWDLRSLPNALFTGASRAACEAAGKFDRTIPVLGTPNEDVLKVAVGAQIADLYGTLFASLPVFFVRDDHDYFEDDRVTPELVTFPADPFMVDLARSSQWLYYPEFLPDPKRPRDLPASDARDRPRGVSEAFGTLRWGRLAELLLYDCKGFVTLDGADGRMVPAPVEAWLRARMADPRPRHVVNVPSNPPGWSAGKYGEWYPDVVVNPGELTTAVPKDGWQSGWLAQHDRLLAAASAMPRVPLFLGGDIHSIAEERILASGAHSFAANPIVSVITGTPGTGVGWPSLARQTLALPPASLAVEEIVPVQEVNGFHLVDFEPGRVVIRHFRWHFGQDPEEAIDTLEPFHVSEHRG